MSTTATISHSNHERWLPPVNRERRNPTPIPDVTLKDFKITNTWRFDGEYEIDETTQRKYDGVKNLWISLQCVWLTAITPLYSSTVSLINLAYRIMRVVTFVHFWDNKESSSIEERGKDFLKDVARIVLAPIALIGLELAAVYGIFNPLDGRKLYATIERAQYDNLEFAYLAPYFQPKSDFGTPTTRKQKINT